MQNKKHIAFLGTGLMGLPMAIRLLQAGYPLSVWNRTNAKAQPLADLGAQVTNSATAAVSNDQWRADIIITMLDSGPVVEQVLKQILPALSTGSILIDMSSTKQSEALTFHELLKKQGISFVDAPVSGGVIGAQNGKLAVMVGASETSFSKVNEVLSVFGQVTRVGEPGSGQLAKLCNQLIVGGTINIVAEALLLAQAGGADPAAVRQALRGGFAESRILEVHGQRMLDRNFTPGGQVKSQVKDMRNILDAAKNFELELPLTNQAADIFEQLMASHPGADHSAALLELESRNSGIRSERHKNMPE
ncbi:NAD(P)-dependent oxidoreductase [Undibacterium sp. SXout11W]|uniref:NAD(P)-dependent oxidoreductase n=1 Tax=Undibacterium sp. SXout11W TaxID=3413050 RepID=UPI003BF39B99